MDPARFRASRQQQMMTISAYIQNEVMEIQELNLMATDIPETCQTIIVATPTLDFYDTEVEKLTNYINRGGNIIWMQDPTINELDLPNTRKILNLYGVEFHPGMVIEQDANRMIMENPQLILPNISYNPITQDISNSGFVLFASAGKLTTAASEKLEELNVTVDEFLTTSAEAFYRTDFTITTSDSPSLWIIPAAVCAESNPADRLRSGKIHVFHPRQQSSILPHAITR